MPTKRRPKKTIHEAIRAYCRSAGIASTILGMAGLMQEPDYFWYFVGFIYIGLFLLGADVFLEAWPRRWVRWAGVTAIAIITVIFSVKFVFVRAPIQVSAMSIPGDYPKSTTIASIPWRREFAEMDVSILNNSSMDYTNINLVLRPDLPVAAIGQLTHVSGVRFEESYQETAHEEYQNLGTGTEIGNPLQLIATDTGYRMRCKRLPSHSLLAVVMAVVTVRPIVTPKGQPYGGIFDKGYYVRITRRNGLTSPPRQCRGAHV